METIFFLAIGIRAGADKGEIDLTLAKKLINLTVCFSLYELGLHAKIFLGPRRVEGKV